MALWPVVLALATRILGSSVEAEDAAQEAMYRVFSRIDELDLGRSGVSWALGITAWQCRAMRTSRARRREDPVEVGVEVASEAPSLEAEAMDRELIEIAQTVVGSLPPADQETLWATFNELPDAKGVSFRKRRERALTRLRLAWRRLHETF
jgi:RNA polymerase sigma-70 factor (ECF subfamily)